MSVHSLLDKAAGDRDWHNFTLLNDLVDKLCLFGPAGHLGSEQIAGRQMYESAILNQFGALSSLTGSWASIESRTIDENKNMHDVKTQRQRRATMI